MPGFDIHPILVHFPIAILSTYTILEFLRFRFLTRLQYWFYIKALLAILGSLATLPTMLAGLLAKSLLTTPNRVVDLHEKFAISASTIFLFIGFLYFLAWIKPQVKSKNNLLQFVFSVEHFIFEKNILIPVAFVGLILITITGALGGIIVFGPGIDPFSKILFNLLLK